LSLEVLLRIGRKPVSAMIARSPVTFILLDMAGSGDWITPRAFGTVGNPLPLLFTMSLL
jgi:hypothetical protein